MFKLQTAMTPIIRNHLTSANPILLGKINYSLLPNKIVIRIPYYSTQSFLQTNTDKLGSALQLLLSSKHQLQNQNISHLELRFIPLQYPYLDSYILNQYIAINASKYNFSRIQKLLFNKVSPVMEFSSNVNVSETENGGLVSKISGLKMELSGRLTTQRSIPRKTVSNAHIGKFKGDSTMTKDTSQYPSKNKLGAFTIKVWLGNV